LKGYLKIISIRQGSEPYLNMVLVVVVVVVVVTMVLMMMMMTTTMRNFQRIRTDISKVQYNSDKTQKKFMIDFTGR
jgi:cell division protein FtsL